MRDPRPGFNLQSPGQRKPQLILTNRQLRRLKVLACAAAGKLNEPVCIQLKASSELDADLHRLAERLGSRLGGDDNYVLRRGALLHADLAMRSSDIVEP